MRGTDSLVRAVEAAAAADGFTLDAGQRAVLERLAVLGGELTGGGLRRGTPRGVYLHGPAGRGKSWLADAFFTALPLRRKTRVHFHGFFDALHRSIHAHRDEREAVQRAIDDVTGDSRLLFFDELHVHDSGDARLLTRLLEHVFTRRLTVLATSNYAPAELLPNPIWHHIFEPGIALLTQNLDVVALRGPVDYRTMRDDHSRGFAAGTWSTGAPPQTPPEPERVTVDDRSFEVAATGDGALTATFDQLCRAATSTVEYLHWARTFSHWVVTDVPRLSMVDPEAQQRFINLINVLVDEDVRVDVFADVDLDAFLADASPRPDAFRMASRLRLLRTSA